MSSIGGLNIIRNGLVLHLDVANNKCFRGEPTINLANTAGGLIDWTISNLIASVTLTTIESGLTYRITSTTGGAFRIRFLLSKLVNAETYTMSYKYKIISGGPTFQATDWCDQSITRVTTNMGDYYYETAMGSRSTYDSTYRFMDFTISDNTIVEIWDIQLEQKTYATTFVQSERGTTVATGGGTIDLSKNGNNGTVTTGITYSSSNYGRLNFDGVNDYITVQNSITSSFNTQGITAEAWVNNYSLSGSNAYINNWFNFTTTQKGFILRTYNGQSYPSFWWCWGSISGTSSYSTVYATSTPMDINKWYHVVGVYEKGVSARIYVNGVLKNTNTSVAYDIQYDTINGLEVGKSNINASRMNGDISIAKIYNRVLRDSEILQNYNATKSRFGL